MRPRIAGLLLLAVVAGAASGGNLPYEQYCLACHGADARGIDGLGVDLTASPLVASASEQELVQFIKAGRMADDPRSVTKRPMPGFAWAPDAELQAIAAWLKANVYR